MTACSDEAVAGGFWPAARAEDAPSGLAIIARPNTMALVRRDDMATFQKELIVEKPILHERTGLQHLFTTLGLGTAEKCALAHSKPVF
jgi:hypothetical protein